MDSSINGVTLFCRNTNAVSVFCLHEMLINLIAFILNIKVPCPHTYIRLDTFPRLLGLKTTIIRILLLLLGYYNIRDYL